MKRYTVIWSVNNSEYSEILDKESIEQVNNEIENRLINSYFILKNPDGLSRIQTAHVASVDIFEGSDVS